MATIKFRGIVKAEKVSYVTEYQFAGNDEVQVANSFFRKGKEPLAKGSAEFTLLN